MAVFTTVDISLLQPILHQFELGKLVNLESIQAGIENSNYFLTTQKNGSTQTYVLTLFERLNFDQAHFYLRYMQHLHAHQLPVPLPMCDAHKNIIFYLQNKPATIISRLAGMQNLAPDVIHCESFGATIAQMHLAAQHFTERQDNLRGLNWWIATAPLIQSFLNAAQNSLLEQCLKEQIDTAEHYRDSLPKAVVHADLFRDNVMFINDRISGVFDFYFAGYDYLLFDLCVALNDWCIDLNTGAWKTKHFEAMVKSYDAIRPLTELEIKIFPIMTRAAALRFWISRNWDLYLPRKASLLKPHDPHHFENVLRCRLEGDTQTLLKRLCLTIH